MTAPALLETDEPTAEAGSETPAPAGSGAPAGAVVAELLVEEISIDGMCGVY
jgi:mycofactocin precursor